MELNTNQAKNYTGCNIFFTKEYNNLGCEGSNVDLQNGLSSNIKLKTSNVDQLDYYTPITSQVEAL